jgi:hypothetical protein
MTMTLIGVKALMMERRRATLTDIAVHFGSSPDAARQIMRLWLDKGRVRVLERGACKGGCSCATPPVEVYEWVL